MNRITGIDRRVRSVQSAAQIVTHVELCDVTQPVEVRDGEPYGLLAEPSENPDPQEIRCLALILMARLVAYSTECEVSLGAALLADDQLHIAKRIDALAARYAAQQSDQSSVNEIRQDWATETIKILNRFQAAVQSIADTMEKKRALTSEEIGRLMTSSE